MSVNHLFFLHVSGLHSLQFKAFNGMHVMVQHLLRCGHCESVFNFVLVCRCDLALVVNYAALISWHSGMNRGILPHLSLICSQCTYERL